MMLDDDAESECEDSGTFADGPFVQYPTYMRSNIHEDIRIDALSCHSGCTVCFGAFCSALLSSADLY